MNNERDELSYCISAALGSVCGIYDTTEDEDREMAALLIDNGYRKPRTVTTAAELDALPVGSVVLDNEGDVWQHRGYAAYQWCNTTGGRNSGLDTSEFAADCLPATVLHEGEK